MDQPAVSLADLKAAAAAPTSDGADAGGGRDDY